MNKKQILAEIKRIANNEGTAKSYSKSKKIKILNMLENMLDQISN